MLFPIVIRPSRRLDGQFDARLGDRPICTCSEPLLASARVLIADGVDPAAVITMRHAASAFDTTTAKIGVAWQTVREDERKGPTFRRWKLFPVARCHPSVRFFCEVLGDAGQAAETPPLRSCAMT